MIIQETPYYGWLDTFRTFEEFFQEPNIFPVK